MPVRGKVTRSIWPPPKSEVWPEKPKQQEVILKVETSSGDFQAEFRFTVDTPRATIDMAVRGWIEAMNHIIQHGGTAEL
jgi:hypothetical protein